MKEIKIVIVDDSPFSVNMISKILNAKGFHVVGSASCLSEAVTAVAELKPDLVTMDMTMPGADGIECTRAIHKIDPEVKVVMVSSMMDDEIVRNAKRAKISGYIQKPVDEEELTLLINRVMADEELFAELDSLYFDAFKEAFSIAFGKFFKETPEFTQVRRFNDEKSSGGYSVVMGIIGKYGGRMILDMTGKTAGNIAGSLIKDEALDSEHIANVITELSNIIAGNACSLINKTNGLYGFRVAPATVVYGESVRISKSELSTVSSATAETSFGNIYINAGFSRSGNYE